MKAVILAGGVGSRLGGLRGGIPKVMLPIAGKPILEHNLRYLKKAGIREVIINLHYRPLLIRRFLQRKRFFGMKIRLLEEPELLGTAGTVKSVRKELGRGAFLVLYGDNLMDFNIAGLVREHRRAKAMVTLGVYNPEVTDWCGVAAGLIELDKGRRIVRFREKRSNRRVKGAGWVNGGILIASPKVFKHMPRKKVCDFGRDVFPALLRAKKRLQAVGGATYVLASDTMKAWKQTQRIAKKRICS